MNINASEETKLKMKEHGKKSRTKAGTYHLGFPMPIRTIDSISKLPACFFLLQGDLNESAYNTFAHYQFMPIRFSM